VIFCRVSAGSETTSAEKDSLLEIYLPREVAVKDDIVSLGQVSVIQGDKSLAAKASEIALGRISVPGQKIILDRPMVLGRLACSGIPVSKVELNGAERVTIRQRRQIIKGGEFVETARAFLEKKQLSSSICQLDAVQTAKDLVTPLMCKSIKLSPDLVKSNAEDKTKVRVVVFADGEEIGVREVTFRLKYNCRRAVTLVELGAGAIIGPENVKIERTESNHPEPAGWRPPYGLVARRRLPANTVIRPELVGPVRPEVVLKRNQNVVIQVERPGLMVTAIGKTMQDGRVGEYIKVRNVDSQRIILARVNEDGTVEPVL
jgi:flagella basal body P-ring formation protein FlgA